MLTSVYHFKLTRGIFVTDAWWRIRGCSASGLTALSFSCTSAPEPGNQNHQIPERGVGDITDHVPTCLPQPQLDLCWITPGWVTWPRVSAAVNLLGVRFIASFPPEKRHRFPLSFLALWPLFEVTADKKGHLKRTDWNFFCISTKLSIKKSFLSFSCVTFARHVTWGNGISSSGFCFSVFGLKYCINQMLVWNTPFCSSASITLVQEMNGWTLTASFSVFKSLLKFEKTCFVVG